MISIRPLGMYAELLIYVSQGSPENLVVAPYVLRLRYHEAAATWHRDSLWMFGPGAPKLIF